MLMTASSHLELEVGDIDNISHRLMLWQEIALAIRHAPQPQRSDLFIDYFELGLQIAMSLPINQQWQFFNTQLQLLLSTIEDPLIPQHWRRMCFESLHRPLLSLKGLTKEYSNQSELNDLYTCVNQQINAAFSKNPF
ncbi:MAG: hypothetical protein HRU25_12695 [Psychrobium sp.]|nr:hypothetical protein [Psychrobium sp.]